MKEDCDNKDCRHDKDSHHREYESSPDGIPRPVWWNCLARFCQCKKYKPKPKEEKS